MCENFSKIGPIIKKIPNFVIDPLQQTNLSIFPNAAVFVAFKTGDNC